MSPDILVPTPESIPVPWPWFKAFLIPCFTVHLIFVNALLGTGIIGWIGSWRSAGHPAEAVRSIDQKLPIYMAFAINFGVAALLFMQVLYGHLFYTSSILMATWWLGGLGLVLVAYMAAYWLDFKSDILGVLRVVIFSLMVFSLLIVAFVFVNNMTLMVDPPSWPQYFARPNGTLWHWDDATLLPRYLHFVTAAIAVGGLLLALIHRIRSPEQAGHYLQWFTGATLAQLVIGGWFFMALPQAIRTHLMGGNPLASAALAISLLGVMFSLFFSIRQMIRPAAWAAGFTILAMVLVRDAVRTAYLAPYFSPGQLKAGQELSPLLIFALFLGMGITTVVYLFRLWKGAAPR